MKLFLLLCLMTTTVLAQPRRIWLDTDIMVGMKDETPREVDDAASLPSRVPTC